jgi:hypothetical protein
MTLHVTHEARCGFLYHWNVRVCIVCVCVCFVCVCVLCVCVCVVKFVISHWRASNRLTGWDCGRERREGLRAKPSFLRAELLGDWCYCCHMDGEIDPSRLHPLGGRTTI